MNCLVLKWIDPWMLDWTTLRSSGNMCPQLAASLALETCGLMSLGVKVRGTSATYVLTDVCMHSGWELHRAKLKSKYIHEHHILTCYRMLWSQADLLPVLNYLGGSKYLAAPGRWVSWLWRIEQFANWTHSHLSYLKSWNSEQEVRTCFPGRCSKQHILDFCFCLEDYRRVYFDMIIYHQI